MPVKEFREYSVSDPDILGDYSQAYWTDFFFKEAILQGVRDLLDSNYYSGDLFAKTAFYNGSGQFGCIYRLQSATGHDLPRVLKLYTREFPSDVIQRQKQISETICSWKIQKSEIGKYFVRYEYYSKGFLDLSDEQQIAPFLIMDLVREATPLSADYLRGKDTQTIKKIADDFLNLMQLLDLEKVGYGDLSPGNILVTMKDGEPHLILVDYDDMYVPKMGLPPLSLECGKPAYQHRSRSQESNFPLDEKIHYFSSIVYYLTLLVLSISKETYQEQLDAVAGEFNDVGILFTATDLFDPKNSLLFTRLKRSSDPDVKYLAHVLYRYALAQTTDGFESLPQLLAKAPSKSMGVETIANGLSLSQRLKSISEKRKEQPREATEKHQKNEATGYDSEVLYHRALSYVKGDGVEKSPKRAFEYFLRSAGHGYAPAQFRAGLCYQYAVGTMQDLEQAVYWYTRAAAQGHVQAQNKLGWCYQHGLGVSKSPEIAARWYRKAAKQGHASGQNNLGWCYQHGLGVSRDPEKAVEWYRKAAEQGHTSGQNNLGWCYQHGYGVPKMPGKAFDWYIRAAERGHANAQNKVGWCYEHGFGSTNDVRKAVEWYRRAAVNGQSQAQNKLGWCYQHGYGVTKDPKKAMYWYTKSAEQGNADARNTLGWCYEHGFGTAKNLAKARHWYRKSLDEGYTAEKQQLNSLL